MALEFVGRSNIVATNNGTGSALTPHANTQTGDLLVWYHYAATTGTNETAAVSGWTEIYQAVSLNNGILASAWHIRAGGETTYSPTLTNHGTGTSGETIMEWIETWRGHDPDTPIGDISSSMSTWAAHATNAGPVAATGIAAVPVGAALIVHAGRHDDLTTIAQTTLTGDSLTWAGRGVDEGTLGADAAMFTQSGMNNTAGELTSFTDKTITGFGTATAATGCGRMFVILAAPPADLELVQELDGQSQAGNQTFNATLAQVGDRVVLIQADNFYTLANLLTPTGTAVTTWEERTDNGLPVDGGTNDNHARVWTGVVTTAGGTVIANRTNVDDEGYAAVFVFRGAAGTPEFDTGDGTETDSAGTAHAAPSLNPTSGKLDDFMACVWGTLNAPTNYTPPGGMTAYTEQDVGGVNTYRAASEQLASDAATGTRTATSSASTTWFAVSVLIRTAGGGGTPVADSDSATVSDAVTARGIAAADTATVTEQLNARAATAVDAATIGDQVAARALTAADTIGVSDAVSQLAIPKADGDQVTVAEQVTARGAAAADTATVGEQVAARALTAADSATVADAVAARAAGSTDQASVLDQVSARGVAAADQVTVAEQVAARQLTAGDTIGVSEAAIVDQGTGDKLAGDTATVLDQVAARALTAADTIGVADAVSVLQVAKVSGDTIGVADAVAARALTAAELVDVAEQIVARAATAGDTVIVVDAESLDTHQVVIPGTLAVVGASAEHQVAGVMRGQTIDGATVPKLEVD